MLNRDYKISESAASQLSEMSKFQRMVKPGSCVTTNEILERCINKIWRYHSEGLQVFEHRRDSIFDTPEPETREPYDDCE